MANKMWASIFSLFIIQTFLSDNNLVQARKHHLEIRNDERPYIALSTFGFYTGGHLDVKLSQLIITNAQDNDLYGLTLDKTAIDEMNPYLDSHQNKCILEEPSSLQHSGPILFFLLDFKNSVIKIQCSPEWKNQHIYKNRASFPMHRGKRQSFAEVSDSSLFLQRHKRAVVPGDDTHGLPVEEENFDDESVEMPVEPSKQEQDSKSTAVAALAASVPLVKSPAANVPVPKPSVSAVTAAAILSVSQQESQPTASSKQAQEPSNKPDSNIPYASNEIMQYPLCNSAWPLNKTEVNYKTYYNISFSMLIGSLRDEGLYNLYFHACPNYRELRQVSFIVDIEENNNGNFLSAGEMPLPALYFMMSLLFFLSGLFWVFILKKSHHDVYKIHWLMAVLVFLKSLSLMFHAINYHFIETRGEHVEAWAILYYITHLLKGAVLFITIVLIGTGWTFIKHILSDKDKKIFMIVIPLQVLANVAEIIIDESEEGDIEFHTWRSIFIIVDLICCGAILFPIVWSIRHLCEASATDGKAAINLRKLKLFRTFYIVIVCYIYFTRIIVYLLKMTVAFQYGWLDAMCHEMATYVFFVLTGYKFRPASSHTYFALGEEDTYDDEVEVLTESGLTEGLHRTKALNRNALPPAGSTHTTIIEDESDLYDLDIKIAALWPDINEEQYRENNAEAYEKACELSIGSIIFDEHENLLKIFKFICNSINIEPPEIRKIYRPNKSEGDSLEALKKYNSLDDIIVQLCTPMAKNYFLESIAKFAKCARKQLARHYSGYVLDAKPPSGPFYISMQYNAVILNEIWKMENQIAGLRADVREVQHQFAKLEDYSKACELLITGIPFIEGENLTEIFKQICNTIKIEPPKMQSINRIYKDNKRSAIKAELWTPSDKHFVLNSIAQFEEHTKKTLKLCHAGFNFNESLICIKDSITQHSIDQKKKVIDQSGYKNRLLIQGIPFQKHENLLEVIKKMCSVLTYNMYMKLRMVGRLPDQNVFVEFVGLREKHIFVYSFRDYQSSSSEPLRACDIGFYIACPIFLKDYPLESSYAQSTVQLIDQEAKKETNETVNELIIEGIPFNEHENLSEIFEKICDVLLISPIKIQNIYRVDRVINVQLCTRSDKNFVLESLVLFSQRTKQPLKLYHAGINIDDKPISVKKCETTKKMFLSHIQSEDLALEDIDMIHFKTQIDVLRQEVHILRHQLAKEANYSTAVELTLEGFPADEPNIFKKICDTIQISPPKTLNILPLFDTAKEESGNKSAAIKVELWTPTDQKKFLESVKQFTQSNDKQCNTSTYVKNGQGQKIICRSLSQFEMLHDNELQQIHLKEDRPPVVGQNRLWNLNIVGVPYNAGENLSMIFANLCNILQISQHYTIQEVFRIGDETINVKLLAPEHSFFFLDSVPTSMQFTTKQLRIGSILQQTDMPIFIKVYNLGNDMQHNNTSQMDSSDQISDQNHHRLAEQKWQKWKLTKPIKLKVEGIPFNERENLSEIYDKLCEAINISIPAQIIRIYRRHDKENNTSVIIMKLLEPTDKTLFINPSDSFKQISKAAFRQHCAGFNNCDDSPIIISQCEDEDLDEMDVIDMQADATHLHQIAQRENYAATCRLRIEGIPFDKEENLAKIFENLCKALYLSTPLEILSISRLRNSENEPTVIIVEFMTPTDKYIFLDAVTILSLSNEPLKLSHAGVKTCANSPISIKNCSSGRSLLQTALQDRTRYEIDLNQLQDGIDNLRIKVREAQRQLAEQEVYATAYEIRIENVPFEDDECLYGIFKALCYTINIATPQIHTIYRAAITKPNLLTPAERNKPSPIIVKLWTPADAYFVLLSIAKFSQRTKQTLNLSHLGFGKNNFDARFIADRRASFRARKLKYAREKIFWQRRKYRRAAIRNHSRAGCSSDEDYPPSFDNPEEDSGSSNETEFNVDPNIDINTPICVKECLVPRNLLIFKVAKQFKEQNQLSDVFIRRGLVYVKTFQNDTATCIYSVNMLNDFVHFPDPVRSIAGFEVYASD